MSSWLPVGGNAYSIVTLTSALALSGGTSLVTRPEAHSLHPLFSAVRISQIILGVFVHQIGVAFLSYCPLKDRESCELAARVSISVVVALVSAAFLGTWFSHRLLFSIKLLKLVVTIGCGTLFLSIIPQPPNDLLLALAILGNWSR